MSCLQNISIGVALAKRIQQNASLRNISAIRIQDEYPVETICEHAIKCGTSPLDHLSVPDRQSPQEASVMG